MKKITLFLFMMLAAMAVKAQVYAGGSLGFWYDNGDDGGIETTTFTISPEIGYNLNSKWAIGVALGFLSHNRQRRNQNKDYRICHRTLRTFFFLRKQDGTLVH